MDVPGSEVLDDGDDEETPLQEAVASAVSGLTLLVGLGLLFLGVEAFWIVFVVGFAGVLPAAVGLARYYEQREESGSDSSETEDALEALRERYARGEIDEVEFERRVEALVGTESVADARQYADGEDPGRARGGPNPGAGAEEETASEVERDLERE